MAVPVSWACPVASSWRTWDTGSANVGRDESGCSEIVLVDGSYSNEVVPLSENSPWWPDGPFRPRLAYGGLVSCHASPQRMELPGPLEFEYALLRGRLRGRWSRASADGSAVR